MCNTKGILTFFYNAYASIIDSGYGSEVDCIDSIKPIEDQDPYAFLLEYVWVVLNAGMKEQVARKIYERYIENFDISTIRHPSKKKAIAGMMDNYHKKFNELMESDNKVDYLESFSWIGPITKYHLARNIGIDTVKPDRHLVRLAETFGFGDPLTMCKEIQKDNDTKLGTIDVILWRYCNLNPNYNGKQSTLS